MALHNARLFLNYFDWVDIKFNPIGTVFIKWSNIDGMQCGSFAPESTRALMVGMPKSGNENHSSLPKITLFCDIGINFSHKFKITLTVIL